MFTVPRFFVVIGVSLLLFAGWVGGDERASDEAKGQAAVVQAELQAAEAVLRQAEANLKRAEALFKQNAISAEEFERTGVAHAQARLALEIVRTRQGAALAMKVIHVATPVGGIVAECAVKEGDKVQKGQVLARLDDRQARLEVERAEKKVMIAEAEARAAEKTVNEARTRLDIARSLLARRPPAIAAEDFRLAELTFAKSEGDAALKKARVQLAVLGVKKAALHLDMHIIRSPVSGIVRKVHKRSGEGVRKLDPVVGIEPQ